MNRAGIHRTPTSSTASLSCSPQGDDTENLRQTEALLVYLTWFTVVNIHYVLFSSHLFWGFGWWSPDKEPDRWSDRTATLSTVSCRVGEEERPVEQQTAEVWAHWAWRQTGAGPFWTCQVRTQGREPEAAVSSVLSGVSVSPHRPFRRPEFGIRSLSVASVTEGLSGCLSERPSSKSAYQHWLEYINSESHNWVIQTLLLLPQTPTSSQKYPAL